MISQTQLGAGYALVRVPPNDNPNEGGGPIRVAPGSNVVEAHAGNTVYRTPHAVVYEPEPGATVNWLEGKMFLPDGRLVPATAATHDMFRGAAPGVFGPAYPVSGLAAAVRSLIPAAGMFAGGFAGYNLSDRHKGWGALTGAIAGGILGLVFR